MPVRLKADSVAKANLLKRAELRCPVDESLVDRRPLDLAFRALDGILAVAVVNAIFRQGLPATGKGVQFAAHDGIRRIPVERQMRRLNRIHSPRGLAAGSGVAGKLVFEHKQNSLLSSGFRSRSQLLIDGGTVGSYIVQPPEVEAADLSGLELLCQRDRPLQYLVLLLERNLGRAVQVAL